MASHDGKDYLVLRCGGTGCMACESTVLTSVDGKPVALAIKDKQVFITGPHFEGTADRLNMSDREGEFILKNLILISACLVLLLRTPDLEPSRSAYARPLNGHIRSRSSKSPIQILLTTFIPLHPTKRRPVGRP